MANTPRIDRLDKNFLINGNFDFWQRNTTFSATGYTADRWRATISGSATITRNAASIPDGASYSARYTSGGGASFFLVQALESVILRPLKGRTVTVVVKIKRNATYDANFTFALEKNATADTVTGGTWSSIATTTIANANIPTASFLTVSLTAVVPNDGTANGLRVYMGHNGSAVNGSILDMAQAQLVIGDQVPTEYNFASANYADELRLCRRYYERGQFGIQWDAATGGVVTLGWPITFTSSKRVVPSGSLTYISGNGGFQTSPNVSHLTTEAITMTIGAAAAGPVTRNALIEYLVDAEL